MQRTTYITETEIFQAIFAYVLAGDITRLDEQHATALVDEINENEDNRFPGCPFEVFLENAPSNVRDLFEGRTSEFTIAA